MKALFVTHKWGDAVPGTGESVVIPYLIDTFQEWGKGDAFAIWTDETYHTKKDIGILLDEAKNHFQPDVVIFTPIPADSLIPQNVSPEQMRTLGCPVISIFFDLSDRRARMLSEKYAQASTLSINIDGDENPVGDNYLSLWTPRTKRVPTIKTIDVSFIGARRSYPDRLKTLAYLEKAGIKVKVLGGRSEDPCTFHEYMQVLDQSLITLNFSRTQGEGKSQIKGRVFEALSAGCCLVEDENPVTKRYLTSDMDYLSWSNLDNLVEVVQGLLRNRSRALSIGQHGKSTFESVYSSKRWWDTVQTALNLVVHTSEHERPLGILRSCLRKLTSGLVQRNFR
ncbi:MAG: glycosyltransferase [Parachlamydiales bacterium]